MEEFSYADEFNRVADVARLGDADDVEISYSVFVGDPDLEYSFLDSERFIHEENFTTYRDAQNALARDTDEATVTLASRVIEVKPYGGDYDCFSVRNSRANGYETEDEKLQRAMEINSLRPMWHCQTFIDETLNLATVGIVRTHDLVNYIATHETKPKITRDGTKFKLAFWKDLKRAGVDVQIKKITA